MFFSYIYTQCIKDNWEQAYSMTSSQSPVRHLESAQSRQPIWSKRMDLLTFHCQLPRRSWQKHRQPQFMARSALTAAISTTEMCWPALNGTASRPVSSDHCPKMRFVFCSRATKWAHHMHYQKAIAFDGHSAIVYCRLKCVCNWLAIGNHTSFV